MHLLEVKAKKKKNKFKGTSLFWIISPRPFLPEDYLVRTATNLVHNSQFIFKYIHYYIFIYSYIYLCIYLYYTLSESYASFIFVNHSQVPERLTYDVRTRSHFEISQLFVHTPVCGCRAVGLAAAHYNWIREPDTLPIGSRSFDNFALINTTNYRRLTVDIGKEQGTGNHHSGKDFFSRLLSYTPSTSFEIEVTHKQCLACFKTAESR